MKKQNKMVVEYVKTDDLIPYDKNPRKNDPAVPAVMKSIESFGFRVPVVIDEENVVVCGHTRLLAAKRMNLDQVPCVRVRDLTPEQVRAYRVVDNKVGELAQWDLDVLSAEIGDLPEFDFSSFGFDDMDKAGTADSDQFGEDFTLPDGEKPEMCVMTFTLHESQAEMIRNAVETCKGQVRETFGNNNGNGNGLYEVICQWNEMRRS